MIDKSDIKKGAFLIFDNTQVVQYFIILEDYIDDKNKTDIYQLDTKRILHYTFQSNSLQYWFK